MQRGKRTTTLRMQQRSKVKTWKNRDKAQKEEETKPVVGCDTEKTIYWLVGIEWDSEGSKNSQLFKDWKEIWTWQKRNRVSKSCVFTFAIFICHFLLKQHQLPTQYKILNHFPHAESLQFTQTTQWSHSSLSFSFQNLLTGYIKTATLHCS